MTQKPPEPSIPVTGQPEVEYGINRNVFEWKEHNLLVEADHITDDGTAELYFYHNNGSGKILMHMGQANLLSPTMPNTFAKALNTRMTPGLDWQTVITAIAIRTIQHLREAGHEENINIPPQTMKVNYLLEPLFALNQPTTIYTAGGKGKSTFADYFAVLIQFGMVAQNGLPFIPQQANVLYLDWEADAETHRRYIQAIKKGLRIKDADEITYLHLDHPLHAVCDNVRRLIERKNIGFVVVDSQMAATASGTQGLSEAQISGQYYNDLRSFETTSLTIDHITKAGMSTDTTDSPYGSIVKYNRSRSQFELQLPEGADNNDRKEYVLRHAKFNLGRKNKPIGVCVDFINDDNELVEIRFSPCNVADNPNLSRVLSLRERLFNALKQIPAHHASPEMIAEHIGDPDKVASIRVVLSREKEYFVRVGNNDYGLLEREY